MPVRVSTGFFGKLPAHGDFIHRGLPTQCINLWDDWLQAVVGATQEQLGERWLDVYLTSPIWRFALSPGVIDDKLWAGISLPSVDRVGRYFPFTILGRAPATVPATVILASNDQWFDTMETIALAALDGQLVLEDMALRIQSHALSLSSAYTQASPGGRAGQRVVALAGGEESAVSVYPYLLDAALTESSPTYSIWSTRGSDRVEPCVATARGLPPVASVAAMYTGQWRDWQWDQPFDHRGGESFDE